MRATSRSLLVHGKERAYLQQMFAPRIFDPSAIAAADFDEYVRAYEAPGAMRAGFELYRTFAQDAQAFAAALERARPQRAPLDGPGISHEEPSAHPPANPKIVPAAARRRACKLVHRRMREGLAPSAIRSAISGSLTATQ